MKKFVLLAVFFLGFVVNSMGQLESATEVLDEMAERGIEVEIIAKASQGYNERTMFYGTGPMYIELVTFQGAKFYVLQIQSTHERAKKYPVLLGESYESAIKTLGDLVELTKCGVGSKYTIKCPDISETMKRLLPDKSIEDAAKYIFDGDLSHKIIITDRFLEHYNEIDGKPGKSFKIVPNKFYEYSGCIGVYRFALKMLIRDFKREMKHREK